MVQLYANGELISTIDLKGSRLADAKAPGGGQGLWLPRMTIGATDRALHGYIQEVRLLENKGRLYVSSLKIRAVC